MRWFNGCAKTLSRSWAKRKIVAKFVFGLPHQLWCGVVWCWHNYAESVCFLASSISRLNRSLRLRVARLLHYAQSLVLSIDIGGMLFRLGVTIALAGVELFILFHYFEKIERAKLSSDVLKWLVLILAIVHTALTLIGISKHRRTFVEAAFTTFNATKSVFWWYLWYAIANRAQQDPAWLLVIIFAVMLNGLDLLLMFFLRYVLGKGEPD